MERWIHKHRVQEQALRLFININFFSFHKSHSVYSPSRRNKKYIFDSQSRWPKNQYWNCNFVLRHLFRERESSDRQLVINLLVQAACVYTWWHVVIVEYFRHKGCTYHTIKMSLQVKHRQQVINPVHAITKTNYTVLSKLPSIAQCHLASRRLCIAVGTDRTRRNYYCSSSLGRYFIRSCYRI